MTNKAAARWISDNLTAIYGYAFARLFDKSQVDDLTQEIVCAILSSAPRVKNDEAFHGFAWRVAENTFRSFIRRSSHTTESLEVADDLQAPSAEQEYIEQTQTSEELYRLRRELSLLSKRHREICVGYYMDHKRCSAIAKEQHISVEMVKYHLFKTRKLLKEGIGMTRPLGEKSYNPGTFRMDFWGDNNRYGELFSRRLPGSIVLAAYYAPMTAEELSIELGVAMPYLEEEIDTLERAGVLLKTGNQYQTNLVILTDEYEKEFVRNTKSIYDETAARVYEAVSALLPEVRAMNFHGNEYDDNRLLFMLLNMAMVNGYLRAKERSPLGEMKPLGLGGNGWVFGYDNDYQNHHFMGIAMKVPNDDGAVWFSVENYRVLSACQHYDFSHFTHDAEAMLDAILNCPVDKRRYATQRLVDKGFILSEGDTLCANFPVLTEDVYHRVCDLLSPMIDEIAACMIAVSDNAEQLLKEYVPASVKDQCADIVKIHHRLDVAAFLLEALIEDNKLIVPEEKTPLCVWGVKKQ